MASDISLSDESVLAIFAEQFSNAEIREDRLCLSAADLLDMGSKHEEVCKERNTYRKRAERLEERVRMLENQAVELEQSGPPRFKNDEVCEERDAYRKYAKSLEERVQTLENQVIELGQNLASLKQENQALLQNIEDERGSIRVMCRERPLPPEYTTDSSIERESATTLQFDGKIHTFFYIFDTSSTASDVFQQFNNLIHLVFSGRNLCVFAHGTSGSGKSHTMGALVRDIMQRLFEIRRDENQRLDEDCSHIYISFSALEIWRNDLYDLTEETRSQVKLRKEMEFWVPVCKTHSLASLDQAVSILHEAEARRRSDKTARNQSSSRGHFVVTLFIQKTQNLHSAQGVAGATSYINLVDLGGSETPDLENERSYSEGIDINKDLLCLERVIRSIAAQDDAIPFNERSLTKLLKRSLSGKSKVVVIITLNGQQAARSQTAASLAFAQKLQEASLTAKQPRRPRGQSSPGRPLLRSTPSGGHIPSRESSTPRSKPASSLPASRASSNTRAAPNIRAVSNTRAASRTRAASITRATSNSRIPTTAQGRCAEKQ